VAARRPSSLTPKIQELVATDRLSRPPVGRLTAAQVEQLVAVAQRRQRFEVPVSAVRAIGALAAGAKPNVAVPALKAVLSNSKAPRTDRIAAARALGTIATPQAERALLAHVRVRDPRVQQDVFAALGTFGGPAAARALGQLAAPSDHAARKQLAFARALIAHRHGLAGPFMTEARAIEHRPGRPEEMAALTLRMRTAKATAAAIDRLRGPTYGIDFADRAYLLRCGPADWTIFLNKAMGRSPRSPANLFDRPWIAAVLAQALPTRETLTTRLVMLTRPTGTQAHIDVARADGEIAYTGTAQPAESAIGFAISDVERSATAPLTVAGRVTPTGIAVETAVAFAARVGVRETASVVA
jgi:HEAT repeat protein